MYLAFSLFERKLKVMRSEVSSGPEVTEVSDEVMKTCTKQTKHYNTEDDVKVPASHAGLDLSLV